MGLVPSPLHRGCIEQALSTSQEVAAPEADHTGALIPEGQSPDCEK